MNPLLLLGLAGGGIALFAATSSGGSPAWAAFRRTANKFAKGKDATALAAYGFGFVDTSTPNGLDALAEESRKAGQSGSSINKDLDMLAEATFMAIAAVATMYSAQKKYDLNYFNLTALLFEGTPDGANIEAKFAPIVERARKKYPAFTGNELVPQFEPVKMNVAIGYGCSSCARIGGRLYRRTRQSLRGRGINL
jgi:hypothetical protein